MPSRRHSTVKPPRDKAREVPKSVELEQRISRLEIALKALAETVAANTKGRTAMQAQLDHVRALLMTR